MNKKIESILESYKDEMAEKLQELIRIESVAVTGGDGCTEDAPYGKGTKESMDYMIRLGESKGFSHIDYDNKICELNFGEDKGDAVGAVSHMDVVPAEGNWKYPEFGGELHDGRIYGRGAVDDKGPAIAVFYAALAIKESGLPLSKNITQIIGTFEEGGEFPCLRYYLDNAERIPSCGIVPDSYFPIAFSEKNFVNMKFTVDANAVHEGSGEREKRVLKSLKGGDALNVVPSWAEAVFTDSRGNVIEELKETGVTAHASVPENGENAISKLMNKLAGQDFEPRGLCKAIKDISKAMCQDTDGKGLGIAYSDKTGAVTNNVALVSYKDGTLTLETNARLPVSFKEKELLEKISRTLSDTDIKPETTYFFDGFYEDPEAEPSKTLIEVYRSETGDMESQPFANGSGSYARIMKKFIPFGIALQNEPLQFHVEDESISVERLMMCAKIFGEALYRLAK